jgi:hypothetical protein
METHIPESYEDSFARDTMRAANALSYGAEPECDELTAAAARVLLRLETGVRLVDIENSSNGRLYHKVYVPAG